MQVGSFNSPELDLPVEATAGKPDALPTNLDYSEIAKKPNSPNMQGTKGDKTDFQLDT